MPSTPSDISAERSAAVELVRADGRLARTPYAYAAVVPATATLVVTAGACPLGPSGEMVAPGDVVAQTEQVMANLEVALAAAGALLADIVKTTVYVASTDRRDLLAAWQVVSSTLGPQVAPSTLLGVALLGFTGQIVEVEAVAALSAPPALEAALPG
jgi:enamine deaminase RidA (YjgF/YER057c/UK114 family)